MKQVDGKSKGGKTVFLPRRMRRNAKAFEQKLVKIKQEFAVIIFSEYSEYPCISFIFEAQGEIY